MPESLSVLDAFFGPFAEVAGIRHGIVETAQLFTLAMARWMPIFARVPYLGGRLVVAPVKIGLAVLLSLWIVPWLSSVAPLPLAFTTVEWWGVVLRELILGSVLGVASGLVFWGAEMGGMFVDTVRGGTVAQALQPAMQTQSSVLGNFYFQLFVVLYLAAGGHHLFLSAVFDSYELLSPFGAFFRTEGMAAAFITGSAQAFVLAAKLIAPALVVVIFLDITLGIGNRLAPQMNVFFLSLPLKSALAVLTLGLSLYYGVAIAQDALEGHTIWLRQTLRDMGAAE